MQSYFSHRKPVSQPQNSFDDIRQFQYNIKYRILRRPDMNIRKLLIRNYKSIRDLCLEDLENALILVGKNSTGKTAVLEIIRAIAGTYLISCDDFRDNTHPVTAEVELALSDDDLQFFHQHGIVSRLRTYQVWLQDFQKKLPSFQDGVLTFTFIVEPNGGIRYADSQKKHNPLIRDLFPQVYCIDTQRNLGQFQRDLLLWMENDLIKQMRSDCCLLDRARKCSHCFACIETIGKKAAVELNAFEAARLLDYKLYQLNLDDFSRELNENFRQNGGQETIHYSMNRDMERMLSVTAEMTGPNHSNPQPLNRMGKGMRSVYMLSLLETYAQGEGQNQGIIVVEEPEIFLHPEMQKVAGEILYRLSRKNQVIFTTHSPNLLSNFSTKQIRQMVLDEQGCSRVRPHTDISRILNDLGYTAGDLMNVNFVFIVEGKQDKSRLPMLLRKYYSEVCEEDGSLFRIAIINTNSCTNIKTYANLKYMNQIYLKDQFLMIRDSDGRDRQELQNDLCRYYDARSREDVGALPRVQPENVLILRYYSFENYFLNPAIMVKIGVLQTEEDFYHMFLHEWKRYFHRTRSGQHLRQVLGKDFQTVEDVRQHMEEIRIYMRGHDIFDLFYGRFRKRERELLNQYVELAPREEFSDILDAIDRFVYFESRRRPS